ncbi:MAG: asparagine synthase (glutamine-hydrolyzing) [Candidatus Brocadiaceae bacterium]|nr:asparagine synthase (glutamine-hydrolyzing) [Candidatus Brocadiaceae bacterium]
MCGICGWVDNKPVHPEIINKMCNQLRHRGPDVQQVKVLNNVGLGHTRLSIIDLSNSANQPMPNENRTKWLVYNGEFYSFQPYREELCKKGHRFISHTDSEVLLHLYEEEGPDFVKKIRGMFAFGLWDACEQQMMIARDRVGIKPLYYYHKGSTFLFASELKALLQHPSVERELNIEAVNYYFMLGYIPRELCIFKNIKKLLPGHYLLFKDGDITTHCYWNLPVQNTSIIKSEEEYIDELLELLNESVRIRLISDVPLGVFLSGGVDSSIIAALMAKNTNTPVKTFSIGFEEAKYNELSYARRIARHIDSDHNEFIVSLDQVEAIEKLVHFHDEPFADSSAIPTYFVSKLAREHVTVVLSGDGGDELFGGYNWYSWVLQQNKFNVIPQIWRQAISAIASLPVGNFKGKHLLQSLSLNEFETFFERTSFFSGNELSKLLPAAYNHDHLKDYQLFFETQGSNILDRLTKTDFRYYLPDDILTKVDRASMAVSLEARLPILDHKVCEFAFNLPNSFKIKNNSKKYLLKKVASKLLPADFPLERKQGFSIPLKEWMQGGLGELYMDLLSGKNIITDTLNIKYVQDLQKEHTMGTRDHSQRLWAVLMYCFWCNQYFH